MDQYSFDCSYNPVEQTITGYACDCAEPTAPTTPSIILDPFGGTGTTALVAKALGRHGISVDMSLDYGRLARWRTNNLDQLAKVQGIKRSDQARAADGLDMDTLFDMEKTAAPERPSGGIASANAKGRTCVACGYRTQRPSGCERCGGDIGGVA